MDDIEDDARYSPNRYGVSHRKNYGSSSRQKLIPSRSIDNQYVNDNDDEYEVEYEEDLREDEKNHDQNNGVRDDEDDNEDDEEDDDELDDDDDEDGDRPKGYNEKNDDVDLERHPKKRKLKSLLSNYEFAPRVPAPTVVVAPPPSVPKPPSHGGRNSLTDWTERETFVLLDAWGERFLQRGRKSLRSEEWQEVAEKVSEVSKIDRTDTQCRNRLDTLKKKYKKEKAMLAETGASSSKWICFKKMDMLMSTPPQQGGLSCGLDSGEHVFVNPRAYSNRTNGIDEMRVSPANSVSADSDESISDGLPPKKRRFDRQRDEGSSFRLLADSIHKFSNIYEKIETSKRQQMLELEKMRMDFHKELEMQKRQIMENAQAEIAKIQQDDDDDEEDNDVSAENASG